MTSRSHKHITGEVGAGGVGRAGGGKPRLLKKSGTLFYMERKARVKYWKKYGNRFQKFRFVPKWPASHLKPQFQVVSSAGQLPTKLIPQETLSPGSGDNDKATTLTKILVCSTAILSISEGSSSNPSSCSHPDQPPGTSQVMLQLGRQCTLKPI